MDIFGWLAGAAYCGSTESALRLTWLGLLKGWKAARCRTCSWIQMARYGLRLSVGALPITGMGSVTLTRRVMVFRLTTSMHCIGTRMECCGSEHMKVRSLVRD